MHYLLLQYELFVYIFLKTSTQEIRNLIFLYSLLPTCQLTGLSANVAHLHKSLPAISCAFGVWIFLKQIEESDSY